MRIASLKHIFLLTLIAFFILSGCKRPIEPDSDLPVANAGPDQTCKVGSYIIFDASNSSPANGEKIIWWDWQQDENNPAEVFFMSDPILIIGFIKEGIYKFTLTVYSSDQPLMSLGGITDANKSEPDEVVVMVSPRDNIIFGDPNLEVHVRYALKKPAEELTETDFLSLDSLTAYRISPGCAVTSLNGIEKCTNLEYLDMGHQRITDLSPLAHLTKLTFLNLTQNRHIKDISPLAGLTKLRYLDLDSNEIMDISPLASLTNLTFLNLTYNNISDISVVRNFKKLEQFWIDYLPTGDLSFLAELKELQLLWMPDCHITDITPIANLKDLIKIYFDNNQISNLSPLSGLTKLDFLYLAENQIVDLSPLEHLVQLRRLRLYSNKITDILPLVKNSGLGEGDSVELWDNPLSEKSINEYIPTLKERGVVVIWP